MNTWRHNLIGRVVQVSVAAIVLATLMNGCRGNYGDLNTATGGTGTDFLSSGRTESFFTAIQVDPTFRAGFEQATAGVGDQQVGEAVVVEVLHVDREVAGAANVILFGHEAYCKCLVGSPREAPILPLVEYSNFVGAIR